MSTVSPMTSSPLPSPVAFSEHENRRNQWLIAGVMPVVLAPVWLTLPNVWGPLSPLGGMLLCLLLASSSYTDLTRRKIYNFTTYTAFAWAIVINVLPAPLSMGTIGLGNSLWGGVVCFAIMLVPYSLARGGAGDVKLAAAIGALVGFESGLLVIAFTYIVAAVCICGWTLIQRGPWSLLAAIARQAGARALPGQIDPPSNEQSLLLEQPVPLAGFFAVGTLMVVFDAASFLRWIA